METTPNIVLPVVYCQVNPGWVFEDGTPNLVFTFFRVGDLTLPLVINYTLSGTATLGVDYTGVATGATVRSIFLPPGVGATSITIDPIADTTPESNETVVVTLVGGANYLVGSGPVVGTISNDDSVGPVVNASVSTSSVTEDGTTNLIYTFARTGVTTKALTVNYNVGGTATPGADYVSTPNIISTGSTAIIIPARAKIASVIVNPNSDQTVETDESVVFTVLPGTGYTVGTPSTVSGSILNDDNVAIKPSVTISVSSPNIIAEDGAQNLTYTFTRSGSTVNALVVKYLVSGSATLGTDYTGISTVGSVKTVTIPAGAGSAQVVVDPTADLTVEPLETVVLSIYPDAAYNTGTATSVVTGGISNDDNVATTPTVTLSVTPANVAEDGPTNLVYTFARSGTTTGNLAVNYSVSGSATSGVDYTGVPSGNVKVFTIPAGNSAASLVVDPTVDAVTEANETVILTLQPGNGYTRGTTVGVQGLITNDDLLAAPVVSLSATPLAVTEDGIPNIVYTFLRAGSVANAITVGYTLSGTAVPNTDYAYSPYSINRTVIIPSGGTTANLTINPNADAGIESNETVVVTVAPGAGYSVGSPSTVSTTIIDDDAVNLPIVTVAASNPTTRLESDTNNLNFVLLRSGSNAAPLTVNVAVSGTATVGVDYLGLGNTSTQSITFAVGESLKNIPIDPIDDTVGESNEYVLLAVQPGSDYRVGGAASIAVFIDNDDSVTGTTGPFVYRYLASNAAADPGPGRWNYNVFVNGVNIPSMIYISNYDFNNIDQTAWLTAINQSNTSPKGSFTVVPSGTLYPILKYNVTGNINIGASFSSIPVEPADTYTRNSTPGSNLLVNFNTVAATPTGPTGPTGPTSATGPTGPLPLVSVSSSPGGVTELGPNVLFTVTRSGVTTSPLTVFFNVSGSAAPGLDYFMSPMPPTLTIPAGAASAFINASPISDAQFEGPETVIISLTPSSLYAIGSGSATSVITNV